MTWSDNKIRSVFDEAMRLRDEGLLDDARDRLMALRAKLGGSQGKLVVHVHIQLGYIAKMSGAFTDSESHFRRAVELAPRNELASISLFLALDRLGRREEALREAVRLLALRDSLAYYELFEGAEFLDEVKTNPLAIEARSLLAKHRAAQQLRGELSVGDIIRLRADAPANTRPGDLATVRRLDENRSAVEVEFGDGERTWIDRSLINSAFQ